MLNRMLEEIKKEIKEKETMERVVEIVEKTNDKEAINHCKMLLNMQERALIHDMEYYIHEYRANEERNYGPRLNTEE